MKQVAIFGSALLQFLVLSANAGGEQKDPLYRDESIAGVQIDAEVNRLESGNWEYVYSIVNPDTSNGTVVEFRLDVSRCFNSDELADLYTLAEPAPQPPAEDPNNRTKFPPMHIHSVPGRTSVPIYGSNYDLIWHMWLKPGERVEGIRIVSVTGPAKRAYLFSPAWSSSGWDYGKYFDADTILPARKDFRVEGMITGPGCEREATEPDLYPGSYATTPTEKPRDARGFLVSRVGQSVVTAVPVARVLPTCP